MSTYIRISELTIQFVTLEDAGRYTCSATNGVTNTIGATDTATAALTVLGIHKQTFIMHVKYILDYLNL